MVGPYEDAGTVSLPTPARKHADPGPPPAWHASGLAAAEAEGSFDRLVRIARRLLGSPMAFVSLVGDGDPVIESALGLPPGMGQGTRLRDRRSFCRQVVARGEPLVIRDATSEPAHAGNAAIGTFGIVAYLGVPLRAPDGRVVGSFCVAEASARAWDGDDVATLCDLAASAASEIRLRMELDRLARTEAALLARQAQRDLAMQAHGSLGFWEWEVGSGRVSMDRGFARMFGVDPERAEAGLPLEDYMALIPEPERTAVARRVEAAVRDGGAYAAEHRLLRPDGSHAWVQSRGICAYDPDGRPARFVGILTDVSETKAAFEHQAELRSELGHRIKNTMATVQAVVLQSLRDATDLGSAADNVADRLQGLSRAHDLLAARDWQGADVAALAEACATAFGRERFEVRGGSVALTPRVALAFSMALHELATNAAKYGALSTPLGRIRLAWQAQEKGGDLCLALSWTERGGPPVAAPTRKGFGSRLLQRVLASEVNGRVETDYDPEGVSCRVEARLAPAP